MCSPTQTAVIHLADGWDRHAVGVLYQRVAGNVASSFHHQLWITGPFLGSPGEATRLRKPKYIFGYSDRLDFCISSATLQPFDAYSADFTPMLSRISFITCPGAGGEK